MVLRVVGVPNLPFEALDVAKLHRTARTSVEGHADTENQIRLRGGGRPRGDIEWKMYLRLADQIDPSYKNYRAPGRRGYPASTSRTTSSVVRTSPKL